MTKYILAVLVLGVLAVSALAPVFVSAHSTVEILDYVCDTGEHQHYE